MFMTREIGRIVISILLLGLAGFLLYLGFSMPEPAQALGVGAISGAIIGAEIAYWLKPG
jgi:hypothetical protein